jgi:hypothetical protein
MSKYLEPGTISHGTLRSEDLIPAFVGALDGIELEEDEIIKLDIIKRDMQRPDFYENGDAEWVLNEVLFDLLNEHCPEGHYFGSTEGDGSDFGMWPVEVDEGFPC